MLTGPSPLAPGQFEILDDAVHGTVVRGLTQVPVGSEEDALRALFAAESVRTTAQHALNARSNRAHCIFTVHLQQRSRLGGGRERIVTSKLHCVDLAGSERLKKTMGVVPLGDSPEAELQRESLNINKSLAVLESVVTALVAGRSHVPYRSSKLTHILKDALGGGTHPCSSVIIACLWGEARHIEECVSTLRLAHRWAGLGARLEGAAAEGGEEAVILDADALLARLARENQQLRQEHQMHGADAAGARPRHRVRRLMSPSRPPPPLPLLRPQTRSPTARARSCTAT
jgi:kinesin family protein 6/9